MCYVVSNKKEKIKLSCTVKIKPRDEINASLCICNLLFHFTFKVQAPKPVLQQLYCSLLAVVCHAPSQLEVPQVPGHSCMAGRAMSSPYPSQAARWHRSWSHPGAPIKHGRRMQLDVIHFWEAALVKDANSEVFSPSSGSGCSGTTLSIPGFFQSSFDAQAEALARDSQGGYSCGEQ